MKYKNKALDYPELTPQQLLRLIRANQLINKDISEQLKKLQVKIFQLEERIMTLEK